MRLSGGPARMPTPRSRKPHAFYYCTDAARKRARPLEPLVIRHVTKCTGFGAWPMRLRVTCCVRPPGFSEEPNQ
jgi:hypothetical protein